MGLRKGELAADPLPRLRPRPATAPGPRQGRQDPADCRSRPRSSVRRSSCSARPRPARAPALPAEARRRRDTVIWERTGASRSHGPPPSTAGGTAASQRAGVVEPGHDHGKKMHGARYTSGTEFYLATGDIYATQQLLGHADVSTTANIYVQLDGRASREARRDLRAGDADNDSARPR